jgi:hypothetical protein
VLSNTFSKLNGWTPSATIKEGEKRTAAPAKAEELEDVAKKQIMVTYNDDDHYIGWYSDSPASDIKEAILCACDAIIDGGFVLRELDDNGEEIKTKTFGFEEFENLESGKSYVLLPAQQKTEHQKVTGDRMRRLTVPIKPTLHVEAKKAIERMRKGSNLLKHTKHGLPHLRQFQLSEDHERLVWYTSSKMKDESVVNLRKVAQITTGQTTPTFMSYRLERLEHLSFSLVEEDGQTLDITCKDHFEFDHWVCGLKALVTLHRGELLSKNDLLSHSKRFRDALEAQNIAIVLTNLPEVKQAGEITLDDCIMLGTHNPAQLQAKCERFRKRLEAIKIQVQPVETNNDRMPVQVEELDIAQITGQGAAYEAVFDGDGLAADDEMEMKRVYDLIQTTDDCLNEAMREIQVLKDRKVSEQDKKKRDSPYSKACRHIEQLLWKTEVDLENIEDIYTRTLDNAKSTATPFNVFVADMQTQLTQQHEEFQQNAMKAWNDVQSWWTGSTNKVDHQRPY